MTRNKIKWKGAEEMAEAHNLKTWTPYFNDIRNGVKTFEVRKNDRNYQVGDTLILEEYNPDTEKYTGAWIPEEIIYKLDDIRFVKEGFVVLGIQEIKVDVNKAKKRK